jgi:hypothetical protein
MTDRYLISQMNAENYVPIKTIANFKMITNLTTNYDLIVDVMKECKSVVVDEGNTMVKPNLKSQRNTLILRDIPKDTTPEVTVELSSIFTLIMYYFLKFNFICISNRKLKKYLMNTAPKLQKYVQNSMIFGTSALKMMTLPSVHWRL